MSLTTVKNGFPVVPGASAQQATTNSGDASYPNPAGYVMTPASFGFTVLKKIVSITPATAAAMAWDYAAIPTYSADGQSITSVAIHLAVSTTGVEVANAVNVSNAVFTIIAEGN